MKDNVVVVNGVSKGYAMTGWRIGYIGAPLAIAKACDKMQGQFTSAASSIAQKAAMIALTQNTEDMNTMVESFKRRRDLVLNMLKEIKGLKLNTPDGAFYVFPDVSYYFWKTDGKTVIKNPSDLCMYLLNDAKVSLVTGEAFGDGNCVRFSYATSDKLLVEACKRLKQSLAKLQ